MRKYFFFVVIAVLFSTGASWAQGHLNAAEMEEAFKIAERCGSLEELAEQLDLRIHYFNEIQIRGPIQKVAVDVFLRRQEAKKEYREYKRSDVPTTSLSRRTVFVYVGTFFNLREGLTKDIVVLRLNRGKEVGDPIRPLHKETAGASISAEFDNDKFPRDSDIRVVVIMAGSRSNRTFDIKQKYLISLR